MLGLKFAARNTPRFQSLFWRPFSGTSFVLKSKGKSKSNDEEINPSAILQDVDTQFQSVLDKYKKKITEIKLGKADPQIFNKLKVKVENGTALFTDIAQTTLKGKFLTITVFDPKNSKRIISAILGANLNLNAEEDPKNPQLLRVALPSTTKDLKEKQAKELKENFNIFRASSASIRAHVLKDLKKVRGSADTLRKLLSDIEKTHKNHIERLTHAYKEAEKSLK
ncbi:hypothetical protein KL930_002667 [Ogataea haglerorum]|uniref:Ribosome-recycling factor, mitochondrial n=1 Tax=Ogataea haglerorum TaxID=1937702 RepID=A0AAN6I1E1_9ASCO|nr:uncharacterized protein KL911_002032 [Ogataea haglerorum]KAG7696883.1 hypothetical protein KL915_002146 [Ogataea haglerorum]KAG7697427.1 hypothetical protein KL951_002789 [Ogataea haglerorum]KAG7709591.1 hypothetical protein KL950_001810 [Ogataea haglerorum]KAG7719669.1 hypothetical protein KL913_001638 [Ogataea haglerorum]KAG7721516.1 hypothetical protein KL949_001248 [Ogataea haglerorum]